jgi:hypothetical protein
MFRLSTGCVNKLAKGKTIKEIFHDGVLNIYSGAQPATADTATSGTLLAQISYASGAFTAGTKSTRQISKDVIGSSTEGHTFTLTINGTGYTYTAGAGSSTTIVATALAALVDEDDLVEAYTDQGANLFVRSRYGGVSFTIVESGTGTQTVTTPVANSRANGLHFGSASAGVLSKESGTWSGDGIADGQAGWFRFCGNATDAGGASTTLVRMDGSISTTLGDLILRSLTVETGVPITIDQFDITFPMVRT